MTMNAYIHIYIYIYVYICIYLYEYNVYDNDCSFVSMRDKVTTNDPEGVGRAVPDFDNRCVPLSQATIFSPRRDDNKGNIIYL